MQLKLIKGSELEIIFKGDCAVFRRSGIVGVPNKFFKRTVSTSK
jgi:hypothetical protein